MKIFLALVCSLALAGAALAKQQGKQKNNQGQPRGAQGPGRVQRAQKSHAGNKPKNFQQAGQGQGLGQSGQGQHGKGKKKGQQQNQGQVNNGGMNQNGQGKHKNKNKLENQGQGQNAQKMAKKEKFKAKQFETHKQGWKKGVDSEKFVQGKKIHNAQNWHGEKYAAFKSYQTEWHDRDWWRQRHNRILLISGGWYYWNAGFWFPAWGYDPASSYYPYDGPIYAYNNLPPDQVIANVQAALQAQGYYTGDVDGLLGPLTRAALAQYQADNGLYTTSAIDEPTLAALGMV